MAQLTWAGNTNDEQASVISCPNIQKSVIQNHYDVSTFFYRLMWGPHIHHGLWEANESPSVAQLQLTQRLASLAKIADGSTIIDIGCGMGGSSIYLASKHRCHVTGVTLSPVQKRWASMSAALKRVNPRPLFRCEDAEAVQFEPGSADVVWSIECTEHLFDKPAFFRKAASWLKPGGRVALCAWLAGDNESDPQTQSRVIEVCEGMFCPSLGTEQDHIHWLESAGLRRVAVERWTEKVYRTWEICRQRVDRSGVRMLAKILGQNHVLFLNRFDAILNAYKTHAMEYGCFIFEKPT